MIAPVPAAASIVLPAAKTNFRSQKEKKYQPPESFSSLPRLLSQAASSSCAASLDVAQLMGGCEARPAGRPIWNVTPSGATLLSCRNVLHLPHNRQSLASLPSESWGKSCMARICPYRLRNLSILCAFHLSQPLNIRASHGSDGRPVIALTSELGRKMDSPIY